MNEVQSSEDQNTYCVVRCALYSAFVHPFNSFSVSTYYVPGAALGAGVSAKKTGKFPALRELSLEWRKQILNKLT